MGEQSRSRQRSAEVLPKVARGPGPSKDPEYTDAVLRARPIECRLTESTDCSDPQLEAFARVGLDEINAAERRLQTLEQAFTNEAGRGRDLRHSLVVHLREDSAWPESTPWDEERQVYGSQGLPVTASWSEEQLWVHGLFYAAHEGQAAVRSYHTLADQAVTVLRELVPLDGSNDSSVWWTIELYRSAAAGGPIKASPRVYAQGTEVPISVYTAVQEGCEVEGFARVFSAAARRVRSPLSCYYSHLEPDCFTASAIKVSRLRHALACSRQPWLPARWFDKLTDGELNAARLRQAARAKRVRSRKQQSLLLYDPGSVARYAPEFAVAIRSALGS